MRVFRRQRLDGHRSAHGSGVADPLSALPPASCSRSTARSPPGARLETPTTTLSLLSLRTRLSSLTMDFNYTWSHSLDDASGLQSEGGFGNTASNGGVHRQSHSPGRQLRQFRFRHPANDKCQRCLANAVWQRAGFPNGAPKAVDAIFGGWQLSGFSVGIPGLPTSRRSTTLAGQRTGTCRRT